MASRLTSIQAYTSLAAQLADEAQPPREMYRLMYSYFLNNGLYDSLHDYLAKVNGDTESLRPLRNPANRVVEFYATHLWPGSLDEAFIIHAERDAIVEPIQQVWEWSNWAARKQVAARWYSLYGDMFIKIAQTADRERVYQQLIAPEYVTEFDTDERGYLTYIRLDVPQTRRDGDDEIEYTRTEVWNKPENSYRLWEHTQGEDTELGQLGTPKEALAITEFGIDFVPFVHAKFRDIGEDRGLGCFEHCIDKIDEANRVATRLHQMLFRHHGGTWTVEADIVDKANRPIPPPKFEKNADDEIELGNETIIPLPSGWHLQSLVPNIQYTAALDILNAHMAELQQDLPELAYYTIREHSDLSGRAIRLLLSDVIDRVKEARDNAVSCFVRANQMALTIGKVAGVFRRGIGSYKAGDFEHTLELPDALPLTEIEQLETLAAKKELFGLATRRLLEEHGYTEDQIAEILKEIADQQTADDARSMQQSSVGEQLLRGFESQFGGGL